MSAGILIPPARARAQLLPFTVTIIDWQAAALERQRSAYRKEAKRRELLFCVEAWKVDSAVAGYQRIAIERTRRETAGEAHGVANAGARCLGDNGERLPMIHTHSDGNCQLSPNDLMMVAARGARFDGVQCGDHHFVWSFAWQIKAIANFIYLQEQHRPSVP